MPLVCRIKPETIEDGQDFRCKYLSLYPREHVADYSPSQITGGSCSKEPFSGNRLPAAGKNTQIQQVSNPEFMDFFPEDSLCKF